MQLAITTTLDWRISGPTDMLLQCEVAPDDEQRVLSARLDCGRPAQFNRIAGLDGVGERIWVQPVGERFTVAYAAQVEITRAPVDLGTLAALLPYRLPGDTVPYLMDSRYCPASRFAPFVAEEFAGLEGGPLVQAMTAWIATHFRYVPGISDAHTTAIDTFVERRGVCRDYAHTLICMARAAAIPARFASGYAPDVKPQDFHALAEVWLVDETGAGRWRPVDATGMADASAFARIAVGRDAADASFLTSYGPAELAGMAIRVERRTA